DLISLLTLPDASGARLTETEIVSFAGLLLVAGSETTAKLIGNAWVALTDNVKQMAQVCEDPSLLPGLIEEGLRYHSPSQCVFRRARVDTEIAGTPIPEGAFVAPLLASANRDPSRFADPDRFDMTREARGHLAFGLDAHYCMGASLSRLEAR